MHVGLAPSTIDIIDEREYLPHDKQGRTVIYRLEARQMSDVAAFVKDVARPRAGEGAAIAKKVDIR